MLTTLVLILFMCILFIRFYLTRTAFYKNIAIHLDFLVVDNVLETFTNYDLFDYFNFSSRLKFLGDIFDNNNKSSSLEKIFVIDYIENYRDDDWNNKMIEMDYFDILFRHGLIDFAICICIFCLLLLSFITECVLLASFVSIFVALILTNKDVI